MAGIPAPLRAPICRRCFFRSVSELLPDLWELFLLRKPGKTSAKGGKVYRPTEAGSIEAGNSEGGFSEREYGNPSGNTASFASAADSARWYESTRGAFDSIYHRLHADLPDVCVAHFRWQDPARRRWNKIRRTLVAFSFVRTDSHRIKQARMLAHRVAVGHSGDVIRHHLCLGVRLPQAGQLFDALAILIGQILVALHERAK